MRPWTISILVAFLLAVPATADARPRSGQTNPDWSGSIFWPRASDDLLNYAFFPKGKDEPFWAIGYGTILGSAFSNRDDPRPQRSLIVSSKNPSNKQLSNNIMFGKDSDAAPVTGVTDLSGAADVCGDAAIPAMTYVPGFLTPATASVVTNAA